MLLSIIQCGIVLFVMAGFGIFIVNRKPISFSILERWLVSLTIGFMVWALLLYALSWLQVRLVTTPLVCLLSLYGWWKYHSQLFPRHLPSFPWWIPIVAVGVIGQLTLIFNSGLTTHEGIAFFGINFHDGLWHVALMETLQKQFPPIVPTYAAVPLQGYHYVVDLFGSELARVFQLSPFTLTFRFLPALFSCLTGLGVYTILRRLTTSKAAQFTGVFLSYFGGSFSFILPFLHLNMDAGESAFWSQQSISTFINLPLGVSFALMVVMFLLVLVWLRNNSSWGLLLAALIAGSLVSIKAYAGLLAMIGFCLLLVFQLFQKRNKTLFLALSLSVVLAAILTLPQLKMGNQTFIWGPGWFLKTMMEAPDRVNYLTWEKIRQVYALHGNIPRLIEYWGIAFVVFIIGNFGMRCFGLISLLSFKNNSHRFDRLFIYFLLIFVVFGIGIPMFFLQAGIVWNTIQFSYYSLFIMSILGGLFIGTLPKKIRIFFVIPIILFSLPSNYRTLSDYIAMYKNHDVQLITSDNVEALRFLKNNSRGEMVLGSYYENAYIPSVSGLATYYSDITQANILLLDPRKRVEEVRRFTVECRDEPELSAFMEDNHLSYIYVDLRRLPNCSTHYALFPQLKIIYENPSVRIFRYR